MAEEVKHKKRTPAISRKEADIITLANDVAASWKKHSELNLIWINPVGLKKATSQFESSFSVRNETKGSRVVITKELKDVNKEINDSLVYVKGYIAELYSAKKASAYYPQFGMVKINNTFRIPIDNDKRLRALEQMIKAIERHKLGEHKYGNQYWTDIYNRFAQVKGQAAESDSTSAEHVSIKAGQKTIITKTLNSLVLLIKANYPDTWKEELRVWGFQKEKY